MVGKIYTFACKLAFTSGLGIVLSITNLAKILMNCNRVRSYSRYFTWKRERYFFKRE